MPARRRGSVAADERGDSINSLRARNSGNKYEPLITFLICPFLCSLHRPIATVLMMWTGKQPSIVLAGVEFGSVVRRVSAAFAKIFVLFLFLSRPRR